VFNLFGCKKKALETGLVRVRNELKATQKKKREKKLRIQNAQAP